MSSQDVDFRLTARNETKAAFDEAKRGLGALGESAASARSLFAGLGTAIGAAAFANLINGAVDATAKYKDLGEIAGTTASRISAFEVPARLAGISMDSVASSVARLGRAIGEARLGDEGKSSLLKALGINADDGRDAAEVYVEVAKAVVDMKDKTIAGKVSNDLLGKSYAELRPFLAEVVAAGALNARVTDEQAEAADKYKDNLALVTLEIEKHKMKLANDLLPTLVDVSAAFLTIANETKALEVAGQAGIVFFQTIAVVGANVSFVLQAVGREIAALYAQQTALVRLDFSGFKAISEAVKEDGVRARAELDALEKRIMSIGQVKADTRDNFDFFGPGGNPMIKGLKTSAEEAVRARMKFEQEYRGLIAQAQGFADRYSTAVRTGNQLIQEARKQGLLSEVDAIRATAANEDARLQVQIQALRKQEAIYKQKGDAAQAMATREKIAAAEAERLARDAIAKAQEESVKSESDTRFKQDLAQKAAQIQEENLTEQELLQHHLIQKKNIIDLAEQEGLMSAAEAKRQREALELAHQAKIGNLQAQGQQQRKLLEQMSMRQQAEFYFGTLAQVTAAGAQHNKDLFELNKIANIANAVMSTYSGATKALEWGWPLGPIFAGIITAAGIANVAAISRTQFQGGAPAATPVFSASPATGLPTSSTPGGSFAPPPTLDTPKQGPRSVFNVTLVGKSQDTESVRDMMKKFSEQAQYGAVDVTVTMTD
jgi:hypothetical protein